MPRPLADLARLDDAAFRARFAGSPIKRTGRDRFVRNVCYAIGNSGDPALAEAVRPLCDDADPAVADAARWALARLGGPGARVPPAGVAPEARLRREGAEPPG